MMDDSPWLKLVYLIGLSLAFVVGMNNLVGCGASEQRAAHITLNGITAVADPTYQIAVDSCDAARDAIVARTGTTSAADRAAMDSIHEVCDGLVLGFESLRGLQLTARVAIDSGSVEAAAVAAIQQALTLWAQLQDLIPQLDTLGTSGGEN